MPYLYAIQMVIPDYAFPPLKVGFTTNPESRLRHYGSGPFPTRWLGCWEAVEGESEGEIHARFAKHRLTGEWFYPDTDLVQFVEQRIGTTIEAIVERESAGREKRYYDLFVGQFVTATNSEFSGQTGYCDDMEQDHAVVYFEAFNDGYDLVPAKFLARANESAAKRYQAEYMRTLQRWYAPAAHLCA